MCGPMAVSRRRGGGTDAKGLMMQCEKEGAAGLYRGPDTWTEGRYTARDAGRTIKADIQLEMQAGR